MRQSVFGHLILATLIFSTLLISGVLLVSHFTVMQGITDAERATAPEVAEKVVQILKMEEKSLSLFTHDWGVWDDTYQFVQDGNYQYIQSNLQDGTFSASQLDLAIYLNKTGGVVFQKGYDSQKQSAVPIPDDVFDLISRYQLLTDPDLVDPITGIIPLKSGPVLIAVQGIYRSDETGPQEGYLIFGRYLDEDRIMEISDNSVFPFQIVGTYADREQYVKASLPYAELDPSGQKFIIYSVISDIRDNPAYLVKTEIPFRTPYTSSLILYLILTSAILCGLFFAGLILYYRRYLLFHLQGIANILDSSQSPDCQPCILPNAPVELTPLVKAVDNTASSLRKHQDELARTQEELAEAEERIRILFEQAQDAICVLDGTKIVDCNQAFSAIFQKERGTFIGQDLCQLSVHIDNRYSSSLHGFCQRILDHPAGSGTRFEWSFPVSSGQISDASSDQVVFDIIIRDIRYHENSLVFIIARDITRQVEFQQNQERLYQQLEENLVHMGALNDQIRNPLTIISTLVDENESPEKDRILYEVDRIDKLIDRLDDGFISSEKVWQYLHKKHEKFEDTVF
ncbi:putative PAS/PAC sensor protein [Methanospirillum hungatei JF-1]|uniref:PAS/PAC sensor protein n=1 Tax=Methanospirillum hungatei JF-1 (strain ATCC 27890 / DSM 864 / NBRC 100397 / JF-1) TaxID=323259 RepID=Q2FTW2_METHJ|nr:CHASE4 domain-containing protein [Methanospirillum hungatei]ABD42293.1 putative PAS/PAC sensor protein [Methanospirillum hungatei JF-1]